MAFHTSQARAARRAAANIRQAKKLHELKIRRIRETGQLRLKQQLASEKALIRAVKAKKMAIKAAKFQRFVGKARTFAKKAKKVKRTFGGLSF